LRILKSLVLHGLDRKAFILRTVDLFHIVTFDNYGNEIGLMVSLLTL